MKRLAILVGLTAGFCGGAAFALDIDPNARAKAVAAAAPAVAPAPVPTINPLPDLPNGLDANGRTLSGACAANSTELCYDPKENRLIYRPSRNWMPEFSGFRAEHISVRKDAVIFKYSFK